MRIRTVTLTILTSALLCGTTLSIKAADHCSSDEATVFSCSVGQKTVSVCSSGASVQYRYGPLGHTELRYPEELRPLNSYVSLGHLVFSSGEARYLRFVNGDYQYIVYSGDGRGWTQEGLVATKKGKVVSAKICDSIASIELSVAERLPLLTDDEDTASSIWELVPIQE